jgi:ribosomal-protein-alanine N-acetyltransferase
MTITIRQPDFTDIERIHAIEKQSISSWSYDQFIEELAREFSVFLAAYTGDILSGYICAWITGDIAEIHGIAVSQESWRRGVGKQLLSAVEAEALNRGCGSILLEARSRNTVAINFYRKNGFTEIGRRKNYYPDDDAILMEKKIT